MFKNLIAPVFVTKNYKVRIIDIDDYIDLFEICSDSEVTKYLTFEPYRSLGDTKNVISNMIRSYYLGENINFAILDKISNKMVGSISISLHSYDNDAEVGYLINRNYWNKGIVSEVLPEIIKICFEYYKVDNIIGRTIDENIISAHLLLKNNFRFYKCEQGGIKIHGKLRNVNYYYYSYNDYIKRVD